MIGDKPVRHAIRDGVVVPGEEFRKSHVAARGEQCTQLYELGTVGLEVGQQLVTRQNADECAVFSSVGIFENCVFAAYVVGIQLLFR